MPPEREETEEKPSDEEAYAIEAVEREAEPEESEVEAGEREVGKQRDQVRGKRYPVLQTSVVKKGELERWEPASRRR